MAAAPLGTERLSPAPARNGILPTTTKASEGISSISEPTVPADTLITVFWDPEQRANINHAQILDSETVRL